MGKRVAAAQRHAKSKKGIKKGKKTSPKNQKGDQMVEESSSQDEQARRTDKSLPSGAITFYRPNHKNGYLSNFYPSAVKVNGVTYPTNEHFFQSKKYEGTEHEIKVAAAHSPSLAFKMGRDKSLPLRADWQAVKEGFMYEGLMHKFRCHIDLRAQLLSTGQAPIVEHTKQDSYWGDGGNGSGKNRLGILLMKVRDELTKPAR